MSEDLKPIGFRPEGLDGQLLATSSWHVDRAVFDKEHTVGVAVSGPVWVESATQKITKAPPALNELSAYQHRYYQVDFRPGQDSNEPDQPVSRPVVELEKAQTWSSELVDQDGERTGYHTVMLDIDHPVRVVPSSTPGHYHLYIDVPVKEEDYFLALRALALAGVIETGYYEASRARGGTHLRLPWIQKDRIRDKIAALGLLEATDKDAQLVWDGVGYAIPVELDRALQQSQRGEVVPADQVLVDTYKEVVREINEALGYEDLSDDDDILSGDLAEFVEVPRPVEIQHADLLDDKPVLKPGPPATPEDRAAAVAAQERLEQARSLITRHAADHLEWDVEQYEVQYVDGKGVLRRRRNVKSQDPQA